MPTRPKLLVTRKLPSAVEERAKADYDATLNADDRPLEGTALVASANGMDALLVSASDRLEARTIEMLPECVRAIATFSVGTDHIDLEAARHRNIVVTNTPDVLTDATADTALLLMLGAARRAAEGDRLVRAGRWTGWTPTFMLGREVTGKRLGIVGMGRIGQAVARRARAFEMAIHYHSRRPLPPAEAGNATYHAELDEMLPHVDFVTLHCPATPETRHLLDARRIALLPDGAFVINTARGAVVDDDALITALKSGRLGGAGLDVFENEPNINPAYRDLPNTFLLPHLGSATVETRNAMGFRALDNLDAVFAGKSPPDRVV